MKNFVVIETLNRTAADAVRDICEDLGLILNHVEVGTDGTTVKWFYEKSEGWKTKTIRNFIKSKYWFIGVEES